MRRLFFGLVASTLALVLWSGEAVAQEAASAVEEPATAEPTTSEPAAAEPTSAEPAAPAAEPAEPEVAVEYRAPSQSKLTYDDYRREELERKARRSRNALIGTSAAAVVGLPLWIAGGRNMRWRRFRSSST